ncbi:MAG: CvpA family protein [Patescibacteria group bacterium]|jgi:membrane protein required for colicin V production
MNILDWIIIIWLGIAFITGVKLGLVYRLGHLIGLGLGIYLAGKYYGDIAPWFGSSPWSKLIVFQFLLIGVSMIGGYVAMLLNKVFNFVSWIPLLKSANRILGGVFGVITNAIIISVALFFLSRISISPVLTQTLMESKLTALILPLGEMISILLPQELTALKKLF